ncbi:MAG: hypothetical protein RIT17_1785 [Pseudomonadota bacterium]|jgi:hypothetical protein
MNRAPAAFGTLARPLPAAIGRIDPVDAARSLIVLGCAAALILARQPFPF